MHKRTGLHTHTHMHYLLVVHSINLEGWLADQTLVNDHPDAPQVSPGIVILGHDDLWGLREERQC